MIVLGIVLIALGLIFPRVQPLAILGGVLLAVAVLLWVFTPGYAYY